jgi:hypothetical protein
VPSNSDARQGEIEPQDFTRWFVDYPPTHRLAGQTVEVTPVPEVVCESNADHASAVSVLEAERDRLRALLKQAHDRDKWQGEFPTIGWYDDVARYFQRECVRGRMTG